MSDQRELLTAEIEELRLMLLEALLQIEYLHEKFGETGSRNTVIAMINAILDRP